MDDVELVQNIDRLVAEEHDLEREHGGEMGPAEHERLERISVQLDQCWDLLRQRRARRNAGLNPDDAEVRSESVVERYVQ